MDGNLPRAKIKACNICDPFVLILREDETIGLFIGESERGKVRRKDMSPMGEKVHLMTTKSALLTNLWFLGVSLSCGLFLHRS